MHEKRGPADYASKDVDDIAKKGLGGKMTTLSDGDTEVEGAEEGTGKEESSGDERKKKGTKVGAKGGSVKSQASSQQRAEVRSLRFFRSGVELTIRVVLPSPRLVRPVAWSASDRKSVV